MITIAIADDHHLIREGLKKILAHETDIKIVGEAGNSTELFAMLRGKHADVLILDVNMPGRSGVDMLTDLRKEFPKVSILMLSMHPEDTLAVRTLKSGASGYVTKQAPPDEIVKAIRKVAEGKKFISETLAERLADNVVDDDEGALHKLLSDREYEVFQLFGSGKTVSEIASALSLSVPTVSTYRSRILEKMKMKSTAEIIRYAIRNKIVE